jgi:hypothetical protein
MSSTKLERIPVLARATPERFDLLVTQGQSPGDLNDPILSSYGRPIHRRPRTELITTPDPEAPMDEQSTPDTPIDRVAEQRALLRLRHSAALTSLMVERTDLRGVHALADTIDDAIRWSA